VPHLIDLLKDNDAFIRMSAVTSLQTVGPKAAKAVPIISDMALQETNVTTRRNCVTAIAAIEPDKLSDLFVRVRKHNDEKVRSIAYQAVSSRFSKFGPATTLPAKFAVPILIEGTKDAAANVRLVVVQGLANLGPDAKDAVPTLTKLLEDPDTRVRSQAQVALTQIKSK
jgi:vesicle coat complex subunit